MWCVCGEPVYLGFMHTEHYTVLLGPGKRISQSRANPRDTPTYMASLRQTLSEASVSAVGSRRSRAAAFGDDTTDEGVACTSRVRGQLAPDEKGVSTSSGETIVRSEGEPSRTDPYCALSMRPGGLGSSPIMPSSHMLVCLGRRSCRRADRRPRGA